MLNMAYAQGANPQAVGTTPSPLVGFVPIILMFVIFYFLLIRPQQKRQKEHQQVIEKLKKNDEVVTTGGIYGTIVNVKDDTFILRIDDNVKIEVSKTAVGYLKKAAS